MPVREQPSRQYTQEEVEQIFERASALRKDSSGPAVLNPGLSLSELERIAQEAGLDPALIRQAAEEVERGVAPKSVFEKIFGAPRSHQIELAVDRELAPEQLDLLTEEMSRTLGTGQATVVGKTLTWTLVGHAHHRSETVQITLRPKDGQTSIRLQASAGRAEKVLLGLGLGLGGGLSAQAATVSGVLSQSPYIGVAAFFAAAALLLTPVRLMLPRLSKNRRERHRALVERLAEIVKQGQV